MDCPVYDRNRMPVGSRLIGATIVEELDSTTVIHPGYSAAVDRLGNLLVKQT